MVGHTLAPLFFVLLEFICNGSLEPPDLLCPSGTGSDHVGPDTPWTASLTSSVTLGKSFSFSDP